MKRFLAWLICFGLGITPVYAQVGVISSPIYDKVQKNNSINGTVGPKTAASPRNLPKNGEGNEIENNPAVKFSRNFMRKTSNQKTARNLLILQEVVNYKMGDEKLAKDMDEVENSKEYNKKLEKILNNLSNKKSLDSKNKKVMQILDNAGERIYNILDN